ncbi:sulfite exporter TauE/SafE family protein [bacterium]|nr:MAG: sulfite exporter TauE/SafE family protein [bacterium]
MHDALSIAGLGLAALGAGIINSVAGGGSLLSFPALIAFGQPAVIANATNTAIVWPGTMSSAYAYRRDFPRERGLVLSLILSSLLGGLLGAGILVNTPPAIFQKLTPFLVLFATILFAGRERFTRLLRLESAGQNPGWRSRAMGFIYQFSVATYGGYFGAGAGMLMLASFGFMGLRDIHAMNALKTTLAALLNGIALVYFALAGIIVWPLALTMGFCALAGGWIGAKSARKMNQATVHKVITALGLVASAWLFVKG